VIVMLVKPDDSALAHIGDNPNKISVLSGGGAALLRRLAREPGIGGHRVRLHFAGGNGAYVEWPDLTAAAHGIAAERAAVPLPAVSSTWR
jgi:hypothetical protein